MAAVDNNTKRCIEEIGEAAYTIVFVYTEYANYLALAIPLLAGLGSAGNLFTVYINHYRKVSGLSVAFFNALLVIDCTFLVSMVFMYSPRGHLPRLFSVLDCAQRDERFWRSIDYAQRTYVITHPLLDLARLLVVWFTAAFVCEQYTAFYHQERLVSLAKAKSAPMKIIVIVFNAAAILSLIHFFKYVRKAALYDVVDHLEVCLSDVYTGQTYINYDVYVYFGFFLLLPWLAVLVALTMIGVELRRRASERRQLSRLARSEAFIVAAIDVGEARSEVVVLTVGVLFLVCYGASFVIYAYTVSQSGVMHHGLLCYLVPVDWRFSVVENGHVLEWVYTALQILYSSTKFPICYLAGKTFRVAVHKWWRTVLTAVSACCRGLGRVCYLGVAGRERFMRKMMKNREQIAIVAYDNRTFVNSTLTRDSDQLDKYRSSSRRQYNHHNHHLHHHHPPPHHHHRRHHRHRERRSSADVDVIVNDVTRAGSSEIPDPELARFRTPNPEKGRPFVVAQKQIVPYMWESNV